VNLYYCDSSALVKRYVNEQGTPWVQTITAANSANIIFVSRITWVEVQSAFARLDREGQMDSVKVATARQLFLYDWTNQYQIVELDQDISGQAGQLVQHYPLRAYDSVQLASALNLFPFFSRIDPQLFTFVCADDRLVNAAKAEGMRVENPNNHP